MAWTPSLYKIFDGNTIVLWGNGMNEVEKFVFTNEFYLRQNTGKYLISLLAHNLLALTECLT